MVNFSPGNLSPYEPLNRKDGGLQSERDSMPMSQFEPQFLNYAATLSGFFLSQPPPPSPPGPAFRKYPVCYIYEHKV